MRYGSPRIAEVSRRAFSHNREHGCARRRSALTLIEVTVVVLILLVLGAGLVSRPVGRLRVASRQSTCIRQLQRIGEAQAIYAAENDDYIPGVNTSGVALRVLQGSPADAFQHADLPVQPQDWLTPLLRLSMPMPDSRAERFRLAMDEYSCPVRPREEAAVYGSPGDLAEFHALGPWEAPSYLMPLAFQYWGQAEYNTILAYNVVNPSLPVLSLRIPSSWEVVVPSFASRVEQVGPPSTKVFVADGTRNLGPDSLILDVNVFPTLYGAFTSSGAWWPGSTEYGVREGSLNWSGSIVDLGSVSNGRNLGYSYRHDAVGEPRDAMENQGATHAAYYDGHVSRLDDEQSRDIRLWYPSGTIVTEGASGMIDLPGGYVVP